MDDVSKLLQSATEEIKSLRKQNEIMKARLDVFDNMMMMLNTPPIYNYPPVGKDVLQDIQKFIDKQAAQAASKTVDTDQQ